MIIYLYKNYKDYCSELFVNMLWKFIWSINYVWIKKVDKKPVLKEVVYTNINDQALEETIAEISETENINNEEEFFELYEIVDFETGLKNEDVLVNI